MHSFMITMSQALATRISQQPNGWTMKSCSTTAFLQPSKGTGALDELGIWPAPPSALYDPATGLTKSVAYRDLAREAFSELPLFAEYFKYIWRGDRTPALASGKSILYHRARE